MEGVDVARSMALDGGKHAQTTCAMVAVDTSLNSRIGERALPDAGQVSKGMRGKRRECT